MSKLFGPSAALFVVVCLILSVGCQSSQSKASPPMIMGTTVAPVLTGQMLNQTLQVTGGTAPYMWSVEAGSTLPPGLMLSAAGVLSGTATTAGTFRFSVRVTDSSNPPQTATVELTVTVVAPLTIGATLPNGVRDAAYSQNVMAAGGLAPLSFSVTSGALPNGLMINAGSGAITGTPGVAGTFQFTVQVRDAMTPPQTASRQFTVLILGIETQSLPPVVEGGNYNQVLTAVGAVGMVTWSLAPGSGPLPQGLMLAASGAISGMPTETGIFNFSVQASDQDTPMRTHIRSLSITVVPLLIITTATLPNGVEGAGYGPIFIATQGGTPPIAFASAGNVPPGLGVNGVGRFAGIPAAGGTFIFSIQASDTSNQMPSRNYTVLILQITTAVLANGQVGQPYLDALTETGEVGGVTWSLAPGSNLPDGLMLNVNGGISGTPTTAGNFNFTVQVTDSDTPPRTHTRALSIQITAGPKITSINPMSADEGGAAFTLAVNGENFVPGAIVLWNGQPRPTLFLSPNQVTADIPATDIATAGSAMVTVMNPPPGGTSNAASFTINAVTPPAEPAVVAVVNVLEDGQLESNFFLNNGQIPGDKQFSISASGRYVAFVTFDGRVLLRDTCQGVDAPQVCTPATTRVSVAGPGGSTTGIATTPSISADGRWVAYRASTGDEDPDHLFFPGSFQFYVHDTCAGAGAGCVRKSLLIPERIDGLVDFPRGVSSAAGIGPAISADGRFVVFSIQSDGGLTPEIFNENIPAVLVHDRDADGNGIFDETGNTRSFVVSRRPDGTLFNNTDFPTDAAISGDGGAVALIAPGSSGGPRRIFFRDVAQMATMELSRLSDPQASLGLDWMPDLNADGTFIAYYSQNTAAPFPGQEFAFQMATCLNGGIGCVQVADLITRKPDGTPISDGTSGGFQPPTISASGRFVAFAHSSDELSNESDFSFDVFVWDSCLGVLVNCTPGVRNLTQLLPNGSVSVGSSMAPRMSANAEFAVFISNDAFLAEVPAGKQVLYLARTGFTEETNQPMTVDSIQPESVAVGTKWTTVSVTGTGFTPGSAVVWNGEERQAIYVSPTKLRVRVRPSDLVDSRAHAVTMRNPNGQTAARVVSFSVK